MGGSQKSAGHFVSGSHAKGKIPTALECVIRDFQCVTLPGAHRCGLLGCDGEEWGVENPGVLFHEVRIMARELSKL